MNEIISARPIFRAASFKTI